MIIYDVPKGFAEEKIRPRDEYVHRIGRTGRVGNPGRATVLFDPSMDAHFAKDLVKILAEVSYLFVLVIMDV